MVHARTRRVAARGMGDCRINGRVEAARVTNSWRAVYRIVMSRADTNGRSSNLDERMTRHAAADREAMSHDKIAALIHELLRAVPEIRTVSARVTRLSTSDANGCNWHTRKEYLGLPHLLTASRCVQLERFALKLLTVGSPRLGKRVPEEKAIYVPCIRDAAVSGLPQNRRRRSLLRKHTPNAGYRP